MALNKQSLRADIKALFDEQMKDASELGVRLSKAYFDYASQAQGGIGDPVPLRGSEWMRLRSLLTALVRSRPPAARAARMIAEGVTAFWLSPPVISSGGGVCTSIVTAPGVATMQSTRANSSAKAAASLANALHMMTKTVLLVYPNPTPPGFLK